MSFSFRPAVREQIRLLIGLSGGTGSGKTFSAMKLAKGLAGDVKFAVIDTENGRASMYADFFQFDAGALLPPFTPDRYLEAITAAEKAGYPVIVVDSMSHEWAGEGGILDMHEDQLETFTKGDDSKRDANNMRAWIRPKMDHKSMVAHLLQLKAHVILCFRAEPKIDIIKENGRTKIVPKETLTGLDGWVPICEKNLPYELTMSFLFTADTPGIPNPIKLQEQHKPFFTEERTISGEKRRYYKLISEESGRLLGEWAKGGTPAVVNPAQLPPVEKPPLKETAPGVYEPKDQPTEQPKPKNGKVKFDPVALCKKLESAQTINDLTLYGEECKSAPESERQLLREVYAARLKQLRAQTITDPGLI